MHNFIPVENVSSVNAAQVLTHVAGKYNGYICSYEDTPTLHDIIEVGFNKQFKFLIVYLYAFSIKMLKFHHQQHNTEEEQGYIYARGRLYLQRAAQWANRICHLLFTLCDSKHGF